MHSRGRVMYRGPFFIQASAQLTLLIVTAHLLAALALRILVLAPVVSLLGLFLLSINCIVCLRRYAWLSTAQAIVCVRYVGGPSWEITTRAGKKYTAALKSYSLFGTAVIGLSFVSPGRLRRVSLTLLKDSLDSTLHRRLRALLGHGRYR